LKGWKDPAYLAILPRGPRTGRMALLYGVADLPAASATAPSARSHNSPASGYAILRSGPDRDATWLCVKYGPHGGGHGHPDKNTFILYAGGQILAADAGTHAYGSPLHMAWDKTTLAHNTLVVDETSQTPATGACLAFGSEQGVDYVVTDAGPIYPDKNVKFVRTLAMVDAHTIVGIDRITTADGKPHTLDVAFHLPGNWEDLAEGTAWKSEAKGGYSVLASGGVRPVPTKAAAQLTVKRRDRSVALTFLSAEDGVELITGTGVGDSTEDRVPCAIFRRSGSEAIYAWTMSLGGDTGAKPARVAFAGAATAGRVAVEAGGVEIIVEAGSGAEGASVAIRRR
jgi:hypothetical protein